MTDIILFQFESNEIRFVGTADNPQWIADDICKALGLDNTSQAIAGLDPDESDICNVEIRSENGITQEREMLTVTEPGLYRLIFKSRKPAAKRMKKWVFSEVLPSIRKTGSYTIAPNLSPKQIALIERRQRAKEIKASEVERLQTEAELFLRLLEGLGRYNSSTPLILALDDWGRRNSESFRKYHRIYINNQHKDWNGVTRSSPACNANKIARLYGYQAKSVQLSDGTREYLLMPITDIVAA
jgi:prophage antirepressor-like protein